MELKNHSLIKRINRAIVLNKIRTNSPISRSKIAVETGLDKKSITNFVTELLKEELVEEAGKVEAPAGRPSTMLRFTDKFVAGIYIGSDRATAIVTDLYGRINFLSSINYGEYPDLENVIDAFNKLAREAVSSNPTKSILGLGVCFPGVINLPNNKIIEAVNIPCLEGVIMTEKFKAPDNIPTFYEHSAHCAALATKWFSSNKEKSDFMVIDIGAGIGAGIINNKRLFHGPGNYAGEIGHIVIEPNGNKCRCGNNGCLESYSSEREILKKLNQYINVNKETLVEKAPEILKMRECQNIITDAAQKISQALATSVNLLSPKVIVLSGIVIDAFGELMLSEIKKEMPKFCLKECFEQIELTISNLPYPHTLGAAALPLSDIFEVKNYYYV